MDLHGNRRTLRPSSRGSTTVYVLAGDSLHLGVSCVASARPEDGWLSIAETFEYLPAEE